MERDERGRRWDVPHGALLPTPFPEGQGRRQRAALPLTYGHPEVLEVTKTFDLRGVQPRQLLPLRLPRLVELLQVGGRVAQQETELVGLAHQLVRRKERDELLGCGVAEDDVLSRWKRDA